MGVTLVPQAKNAGLRVASPSGSRFASRSAKLCGEYTLALSSSDCELHFVSARTCGPG